MWSVSTKSWPCVTASPPQQPETPARQNSEASAAAASDLDRSVYRLPAVRFLTRPDFFPMLQGNEVTGCFASVDDRRDATCRLYFCPNQAVIDSGLHSGCIFCHVTCSFQVPMVLCLAIFENIHLSQSKLVLANQVYDSQFLPWELVTKTVHVHYHYTWLPYAE